MSNSFTGFHMKHKQQMCETNGTFDARKRGHETTHVAAFDSISPMEEFFWTWAPPDSLRGGSGPITKDDLEHDSLSVQFFSFKMSCCIEFPPHSFFRLWSPQLTTKESEVSKRSLFSSSFLPMTHLSAETGVPIKIDLYEYLLWKFHL